jgi:hypothetical protein
MIAMKPTCCKQAFSIPKKKEEKDTKKAHTLCLSTGPFSNAMKANRTPKKARKKQETELFLLHFCATALHCAVSAFRHDDLCATVSAQIHFSKLVGHYTTLLSKICVPILRGF